MRRRIRITVETESVLLVRRRRRGTARAWCARCADFTEWASLEEACAVTSVDAEALAKLIQAEKVHLIDAPDEPRTVCFLSILSLIPKQ